MSCFFASDFTGDYKYSVINQVYFVSGQATNPHTLSKETLYILVACLGAFVLVFLILIVTFILRKNSKPSHRNTDSPEARERMLEASNSNSSNTQRPQQVVSNLVQANPSSSQQVKIVLYILD